MTKKTVILTLISLVLLFQSHTVFSNDFKHTLEDSNVTFNWSLEENAIHIQLSAKTTGWVAVGFNPEKMMLHSNIIMGYVKKDAVKITDHFGTGDRAHKADSKIGGTNHVSDKMGTEKDGVTEISFRIPLDSGDSYDKAVNSGKNIILLAHGAGRDSFKSVHDYRAVYEVDLTTGENKKLK